MEILSVPYFLHQKNLGTIVFLKNSFDEFVCPLIFHGFHENIKNFQSLYIGDLKTVFVLDHLLRIFFLILCPLPPLKRMNINTPLETSCDPSRIINRILSLFINYLHIFTDGKPKLYNRNNVTAKLFLII